MKACEYDNPVSHQPSITPANAVFTAFGVIIRQFEELPGVWSGSREAYVGKEQEHEKIHCKAYIVC